MVQPLQPLFRERTEPLVSDISLGPLRSGTVRRPGGCCNPALSRSRTTGLRPTPDSLHSGPGSAAPPAPATPPPGTHPAAPPAPAAPPPGLSPAAPQTTRTAGRSSRARRRPLFAGLPASSGERPPLRSRRSPRRRGGGGSLRSVWPWLQLQTFRSRPGHQPLALGAQARPKEELPELCPALQGAAPAAALLGLQQLFTEGNKEALLSPHTVSAFP